jgi:4-amino-4-deoxy-L-arabinose transferase-like glycosyltransferase
MRKRLQILAELIFLGLLLTWLAVFSIPFFASPIANSLRDMLTFDLDASSILISVMDSLQAPKFQLDFTGYGQLYYNICILTSYVYSLLQPLTEKAVLFICRLVSLIGVGLSIVLVYLFARRFLGWIEACFAAAVLAFTPAVVELAYVQHPDTLQMFFLILSLYFCTLGVTSMPTVEAERSGAVSERKDIWFIFAAAAAAGAAFSTKYAGAHLLPLIVIIAGVAPEISVSATRFEKIMRWVAILAAVAIVPVIALAVAASAKNIVKVFPEWRSIPESTLKHIVKIGIILATIVIFVAVFAFGSPWSVLYHLRFFPDILLMASYVNFGHGAKAEWFGFGWLNILTSDDLGGPWVSALSLIGSVTIAASLLRTKVSRTSLAFAVVLGWVIIWTGYLIARVNLAKSYYMLPMVPAYIMLAAFGLWAIRLVLTRWFGGSIGLIGGVTLAGLVLVSSGWHNVAALTDFRHNVLPTGRSAENQALGDWFLRCVPAETRTFPGPYSFTPPEIRDIWLQTQGYYAMNYFRPEVIVFRKDDITLYLGNTDNLSTNVTGTTSDIVQFYHIVIRSGAWQQGPEFGQYVVYATPLMATTIAGKGPGCFTSAGYVPKITN